MGHICVQIDAGEIALCLAVGGGGAGFVALEEKVRAVVVAPIRASLALEHKVGVLVRLGLRRLDLVILALGGVGGREHRPVCSVAVV
jgi:hypothetical protein